MTYSLIWLPGVLKDAGLKVALVDGWESRGRGDMGPVFGVICHHTVGPRVGNMPSLHTLVNGRGGSATTQALPGPLSQLGLGRDGTYYVIAAGRCNHAGAGSWNSITNGNTSFIGIEAENTGLHDDFPWPDVQMEAYRRGVAAILMYLGLEPACCAGHKEYALPRGRKPDPSFDMDAFRVSVAAIMAGAAPLFMLIPPAEPPSTPQGEPGRPTLRRGATGALVKHIQEKVGMDADGNFGPETEARVREFQRSLTLVPDGIVGPKTWAALDSVRLP
jgi:hypothetical protein